MPATNTTSILYAPTPQTTNFPIPKEVIQTDASGNPISVSSGPIINGQNMPGVWLLTSGVRSMGWQEQQGSFLTGARLVPTSAPLVPIKYSIKIFYEADAKAYRQLLRTIFKNPVIQLSGVSSGIISINTSTAFLSIQDPALQDIQVTSVVVWSVSILYNPQVTSGGHGPWTAEIEFREAKAFKQALGIPDQSISDPGAVTPKSVDMINQQNAMIAQGDQQRDAANVQAFLPGRQ